MTGNDNTPYYKHLEVAPKAQVRHMVYQDGKPMLELSEPVLTYLCVSSQRILPLCQEEQKR